MASLCRASGGEVGAAHPEHFGMVGAGARTEAENGSRESFHRPTTSNTNHPSADLDRETAPNGQQKYITERASSRSRLHALSIPRFGDRELRKIRLHPSIHRAVTAFIELFLADRGARVGLAGRRS